MQKTLRVILFGATGMIGQGVLRECLIDAGVEHVLAVGRRATGQAHEKMRELVVADLTDYAGAREALSGYDTCFFCLGVSSAGLSEAEYRHVTYDIPISAARALVEVNPSMTFILVSGAGTDSTGASRTMWARVKGEAENGILALPFPAKYAFRPALVRPEHGIQSRTRSYRVLYTFLAPLFPVVQVISPNTITSTSKMGRAMLNVARFGAPKPILETADINAAAMLPIPAVG